VCFGWCALGLVVREVKSKGWSFEFVVFPEGGRGFGVRVVELLVVVYRNGLSWWFMLGVSDQVSIFLR
jgi:hypothetical protein